MTTEPDGDPLFFDWAMLTNGWARNVLVTVRAGVIADVSTDVEWRGTRHGAAVPGLPNVHSHAFQRGLAAHAENALGGDSFWTWRDLMYRFVGRLEPEDLRAIATLAYAEMLESGFTRVGEFHYLHNDRDGRPYGTLGDMGAAIFEAAEATGIALTHLPVFYAHADFGGAPPRAEQSRFVTDLDGFAALVETSRRAAASLPDAVVGIAPHSLRAVTADELSALEQMAPDRPIHMHIAEQTREVEACLAWSGRRPVEWLLENAGVDERWCLVHATHVTDAELASIAASRAVVGLAPITEANLGDGIFPAARFSSLGGRYGVGSDSNVLIDSCEEMRLLEYGQRLTLKRRGVLGDERMGTGERIYRSVLAAGNQALAGSSTLAVGNPADIVGLDLTHPSLAGRSGTSLLDGLIFSAGRGAISSVWRRGEQVVEQGRHRDRPAILARYRAVVSRLLAQGV